MTGGFGPADVLRELQARLGERLREAGFTVVAAGSRQSWTFDGPAGPLLGVHALVMEHPDDVPYGQSFTLALAVAGDDPVRVGLLMSAEQTMQVRAREREVLSGRPVNDVTDYRTALLDRLADDARPRDLWLTAGSAADVAAWVELLGAWLPQWARAAGADDAAVGALALALGVPAAGTSPA